MGPLRPTTRAHSIYVYFMNGKPAGDIMTIFCIFVYCIYKEIPLLMHAKLLFSFFSILTMVCKINLFYTRSLSRYFFFFTYVHNTKTYCVKYIIFIFLTPACHKLYKCIDVKKMNIKKSFMAINHIETYLESLNVIG